MLSYYDVDNDYEFEAELMEFCLEPAMEGDENVLQRIAEAEMEVFGTSMAMDWMWQRMPAHLEHPDHPRYRPLEPTPAPQQSTAAQPTPAPEQPTPTPALEQPVPEPQQSLIDPRELEDTIVAEDEEDLVEMVDESCVACEIVSYDDDAIYFNWCGWRAESTVTIQTNSQAACDWPDPSAREKENTRQNLWIWQF